MAHFLSPAGEGPTKGIWKGEPKPQRYLFITSKWANQICYSWFSRSRRPVSVRCRELLLCAAGFQQTLVASWETRLHCHQWKTLYAIFFITLNLISSWFITKFNLQSSSYFQVVVRCWVCTCCKLRRTCVLLDSHKQKLVSTRNIEH